MGFGCLILFVVVCCALVVLDLAMFLGGDCGVLVLLVRVCGGWSLFAVCALRLYLIVV